MQKLTVTLAIDRYDRHLPFLEKTVSAPEWMDIHVLWVGQESKLQDGLHRHQRMLMDGEFDVSEVSLSSYLIAKDRGLPFIAVPIFPRRLFSQTQIFVNVDAGIETPKDFIGKTVGLQSLQTTLAVLARGDMKFEYGVDWRDIHWCVKRSEVFPLRNIPGMSLEYIEEGHDLGMMLAEGKIDALFYSRAPRLNGPLKARIRRLFLDPEAETKRYVDRTGWYPIMHLVALHQRIVERDSRIPSELMRLFDAAGRIADSYYDDPNWLKLVYGRLAYEEQEAHFGSNLWPSGIKANLPYLDRFVDYALDQQLIDRRLTKDELFHSSVLNT